jgi:hypothetical protein
MASAQLQTDYTTFCMQKTEMRGFLFHFTDIQLPASND